MGVAIENYGVAIAAVVLKNNAVGCLKSEQVSSSVTISIQGKMNYNNEEVIQKEKHSGLRVLRITYILKLLGNGQST